MCLWSVWGGTTELTTCEHVTRAMHLSSQCEQWYKRTRAQSYNPACVSRVIRLICKRYCHGLLCYHSNNHIYFISFTFFPHIHRHMGKYVRGHERPWDKVSKIQWEQVRQRGSNWWDGGGELAVVGAGGGGGGGQPFILKQNIWRAVTALWDENHFNILSL